MRRLITISVQIDEEPGESRIRTHVVTPPAVSDNVMTAIGAAANDHARHLGVAIDALTCAAGQPDPSPSPRYTAPPRRHGRIPTVKRDSQIGRV